MSGKRPTTERKVPWTAGIVRHGAWKQLIPAGKLRQRPVDPHRMRKAASSERPRVRLLHCRPKIVRQQPVGGRLALKINRGGLEQLAPFLNFQVHALSRRDLRMEIMGEGSPLIPPALDRVPVNADPFGGLAPPTGR